MNTCIGPLYFLSIYVLVVFSDFSIVVDFLSIVFLVILILVYALYVSYFSVRGGLGVLFLPVRILLKVIYSYGAWWYIFKLIFSVTCIDLGWIILFIGNLSLSADDLAQ